jgi:hypothetical protein
VFEHFFGAAEGSLWSSVALLAWIVAPWRLGLRQFVRKDF